MKKFFREFKEFIKRGNVVDLSVAVIIGAAFSAIVTALTDKIIMPLINWLLSLTGGQKGLESAYTILSPAYQTNELGEIILDSAGNPILDLTKSIYINWGAFISAVLNFFIIAFIVFTIVKIMNASKKKLEQLEDIAQKEVNIQTIKEKKMIREKAKQENKKFRVMWKEYLAQKEQKLKAEEEAKALEEANKPKPQTEQELLTEIRDLLKNK